jgi:hypothetical protein
MLRNKIFTLIIFSFAALFAQQQEGNKCGTLNSINRILQSRTQKNEKIVTTRPRLQKSIVSDSGKFRIHFDSIGVNAPFIYDKFGNPIPNSINQYVDSVVKTFEYVWEKEIVEFGFPTPPSDHGLGGGDEIDVYIMNQSDGVFGYTDFDDNNLNNSTPTRFTGFINIDNDFDPKEYRTNGLQAMMITAAHEFFHVIQVGNYGVRGRVDNTIEDGYFYELTAEAFEPTVFPQVKDYLYDTKTYFENIKTISLFSQNTYPGYERAIFGLFLMKKYSPKIMKDIWEEIALSRPVVAVQKGLERNSTSVEREFTDFSLQIFYTGSKGDSTKYFIDAKLFPPLNISRTVSLSTQPDFISQSQRCFTSNYIKAIHSVDTVYFIISNTNYTDAVNYTDQVYSFQISLSPIAVSGLTQYGSSIYAKFSISDQVKNWYFYPVISTGVYFDVNASCFPNPFNPKSSSIFFSTDGNTNPKYELAIFSSAMELIYAGEPSYKYFMENWYAEWNGKDNNGNVVASGVYIYVLSNESSLQKGKFAVIR